MFVVSGSGVNTVEEYGAFNVEQYNAYYLMPDKEFKLTNTGDKPLLMFIANCDI